MRWLIWLVGCALREVEWVDEWFDEDHDEDDDGDREKLDDEDDDEKEASTVDKFVWFTLVDDIRISLLFKFKILLLFKYLLFFWTDSNFNFNSFRLFPKVAVDEDAVVAAVSEDVAGKLMFFETVESVVLLLLLLLFVFVLVDCRGLRLMKQLPLWKMIQLVKKNKKNFFKINKKAIYYQYKYLCSIRVCASFSARNLSHLEHLKHSRW